jgi:hypothetical protein
MDDEAKKQVIRDFLDWLQQSKGVVFTRFTPTGDVVDEYWSESADDRFCKNELGCI